MFSNLTKFFKRINFSRPESAEIIIFDEANSALIQTVIPENFTISIFKMRPMEIYISPRILFHFIQNLRDFKFRSEVVSNRGLFYKVFKQLFCIYIKADLISRNPKAIITSTDNSSNFGWLSENYHQAPCIAIQNGVRLNYDSMRFSNNYYYCQHFFCFGEREVIEYPKLGYKVDYFYPVGSLNLSNNFDMRLSGEDPSYDLLVVSCWRGNIGFSQDVKDSMNSMRLMDEMLSRYLAHLDLKAAIILRSQRDSDQWVMTEIGMSEEDYFRSIYGDSIQIIDANFSARNIYPVMQRSDIVISGFATTCLIEAYAMGKKIIYGNFCGTNKYHVDFHPEIIFEGDENSYGIFATRLDELRTISNEVYLREHKDMMDYYMRNPSTCFASDEIRKSISSILESELHNKVNAL